MLGWMITVYRQDEGRGQPATRDAAMGSRVAQWQGQLDAIDWLRDLTHIGDVVELGGNGYPSMMTARAGAVLPVIESGPPYANKFWLADATDILTPKWIGRTVFDSEVAGECDPDEWLIVEIWDES